MIITIKRIEYSDQAILGVLLFDGRLSDRMYTLEHPELYCPEGEYPIVWEHSPRFGRMLWEVKNVPGRSEIKFHSGNTMKDTEGCILLGQNLGYLRGLRAVLYSGPALLEFNTRLDINQTHTLNVG